MADWAIGKVNDALEVIGGGVQKTLDNLHDAEYQDGSFENDYIYWEMLNVLVETPPQLPTNEEIIEDMEISRMM